MELEGPAANQNKGIDCAMQPRGERLCS